MAHHLSSPLNRFVTDFWSEDLVFPGVHEPAHQLRNLSGIGHHLCDLSMDLLGLSSNAQRLLYSKQVGGFLVDTLWAPSYALRRRYRHADGRRFASWELWGVASESDQAARLLHYVLKRAAKIGPCGDDCALVMSSYLGRTVEPGQTISGYLNNCALKYADFICVVMKYEWGSLERAVLLVKNHPELLKRFRGIDEQKGGVIIRNCLYDCLQKLCRLTSMITAEKAFRGFLKGLS